MVERTTKRFSARSLALATGLLLAVLSACGKRDSETPEPAGRAQPNGAAGDRSLRGPEGLAGEPSPRGQELYQKQCSACHGPTGRGDGPAAWLLYPKPRDFTKGLFRLVSTDAAMATDADLFATITRGMPGSSMPPWGHFSEKDRWALVAEVKRLAQNGMAADLLDDAKESGEELDPGEAAEIATDRLAVGEPIAIPPELEATPARLAHGKILYNQNCAPCHDADGRGRLQRSLKDSDGFPIYARDFTQGVFKGVPLPRDRKTHPRRDARLAHARVSSGLRRR